MPNPITAYTSTNPSPEAGSKDVTATTAGTKHGLDVNVINTAPIEVVISGATTGTPVIDEKSVTNLGAGLTDDHDYLVAGGDLTVSSVHASGSGLIKVELFQDGTLIGSYFNSTNYPSLLIELTEAVVVATGDTFRVRVTNREAAASNVYSTIYGETA